MDELLPPLVDILRDAVRMNATDIHIDGHTESALLRMRIEGKISSRDVLNSEKAQKILNQIKAAAEIEMGVSTLPREGQFRYRHEDRDHDVRATVVMTAERYEAAHLRLLTPPERQRELQKLGLSGAQVARVREALGGLQGMALIAGPAGSGKTTTAYSLLEMLESDRLIAASIEDPAEFDLPNFRQVEVDERRGLTMEEGLRTILRMDPDIVLVGEVRDRPSAEIAARAALAGQLVVTTIHARDAVSAILAMHYLSVPYYVLGAGLRLVIAQNLVRRICPQCAVKTVPDRQAQKLFSEHDLAVPDAVLQPTGCKDCRGDGYKGRIGVFEVAPVGAEAAAMVTRGADPSDIQSALGEAGARPIAVDALSKAAEGVTSIEEVTRLGDTVNG